MTEVTIRAAERPNTSPRWARNHGNCTRASIALSPLIGHSLATHLPLTRRSFHRLPYDHRPFARRGGAFEQRAGARQGVALARLDRNLEPVALHVQRCLVDHQVGTG